MKDARWNGWLTIAWASLVVIVSQMLIGSAVVEYHARALGIKPDVDNLAPFADALMQGVALGGLVGILMIVGIVRLKKDSQIKAYLPFAPVPLLDILKWLAIATAVTVGSGLIFQSLGFEESSEMSGVMNNVHSLPMMYLAVVLAAPIFEELLCRGFVISGLERLSLPDAGAIAVALSSFLWAMLHVQYHAHEMFQVFLLGIVLGFARLKTKSLVTPIVIHVVNNVAALIALSQ